MRRRLDQELVQRKLVATRSQAESYIKLGQVRVNGKIVDKAGMFVDPAAKLVLMATEQYVSRAALKLASVVPALKLDFDNKTVLDVGSSTGGFTDYALQHGAAKVIAVEAGTNQLHAKLRGHPKVELHEQTDIRAVNTLSSEPDIILIDVSFISLREILPHIAEQSNDKTQVVAMAKPQFEASQSSLKHKGVIKNDAMRRKILHDFEGWVKQHFVLQDKADSAVSGAKGNQERFYLLRKVK